MNGEAHRIIHDCLCVQVQTQQADLLERKADEEEISVRVLNDRLHSLNSMIEEKIQQASQLEQER